MNTKSLRTLTVHIYTSHELLAISEQLHSLFHTRFSAESSELKVILTDIGAMNHQLATTLGLERTSSFTQLKRDLDENRDNIFISLGRRVQASLRDSDTAEESEAAVTLQKLLDKRMPGFTEMGYATNTAELKLFFADMEASPDAQAALQTLGLQSKYDKLVKTNSEFEAAVQAEAQTEVGGDNLTQAALRRRLNAAWSALLTPVDYLANQLQEAPWVQLMEQAEALISKQRSSALSRQTRAANTPPAVPEAPQVPAMTNTQP